MKEILSVMARVNADADRKLVRFSTENYRLNITLIKRDERWQIQHAEWKYVTLDELYPESLTIFNKIFKID